MSKIDNKKKAFLRESEKRRVARLSRGNIYLQRGMYRSDEEWQLMKKEHPRKLKEVSHKFYPEKY